MNKLPYLLCRRILQLPYIQIQNCINRESHRVATCNYYVFVWPGIAGYFLANCFFTEFGRDA